MKTKLIILAILFVAVMAVTLSIQSKQLKKLNATAARLEQNQTAIISNSKNYLIKADLSEFKRIISPKVDSIISELKIKPKHIERIIERHYYHTDSIIKIYHPEPVIIDDKPVFPFIDKTNCFTFGGNIQLISGDPILEVNLRKFENKSTDIYYRIRSKKFLFIRFGKWQYERHTDNTCGNDDIKEIEIVKK